MRILPSLVCVLVATGCASKQEATVDVRPMPAAVVDPSGVRYPEIVGAYHVGRLVDPVNPERMHEAHTVYRIESESRWDLHPGASGGVGGGVVAPLISSYSGAPLNDAAVAELHRQQEITGRVMQEAARLSGTYDELRSAIEGMNQVAKDHAAGTDRLGSAENRLESLEEQVRLIRESLAAGTER